MLNELDQTNSKQIITRLTGDASCEDYMLSAKRMTTLS